MDYVGKYILDDVVIIVRNYYDGSLHITLDIPNAERAVLTKVETDEAGCLSGEYKTGKQSATVTLQVENNGACSAVIGGQTYNGYRTEITPQDDRTEAICRKGKALVMYASMTGNTGKIASCFAETFQHYGFETELLRITSKTNVPKDFSGYDIVCLGASIIAGSPLKVISSKYSLGGDMNTVGKADGIGAEPNAPGGPGPGGPPPEGMPPMNEIPGDSPTGITYAGAAQAHGLYHPLGIVFTTYGGGFYGSNEAMATLETLKLYLELQYVQVVGKFACCGRETGPAGLADGVLPHVMSGGTIEPPVYYKDSDGNYHAGSYFFHSHMNSKPSERDFMKARALAADLAEDYFLSYDGKRKEGESMYISIS